MAAIGQLAQAPVIEPIIEEGNLQNHQVTLIHKYYIEKHKETIMPWKSFIYGVALISAVSFAIFSQISGIAALVLQGGLMCLITGIGRILMDRISLLHVNERAAEALLSPGFYEYAAQNQENLASAETILTAHVQFLARR